MFDHFGLLVLLVMAFAGYTLPRTAVVVAMMVLLGGEEQYRGYALMGILVGLAVRDLLDERREK